MVTAGLLAAFTISAAAQTRVVSVTNVVTVMVTNVVTMTNYVSAAPPAPVVPPPVIKNWASSATVGLTLTRGNNNSTLLSADYGTKKKTPDNEYSLGAGVAFGEQDSVETVNNYHAFAQWNHLFTPRFYGYLRTDGLRDEIADLDYRFNLGPGLGYYLVKLPDTSLSTEIGGGFEAQRLGGEDEVFATVRLADHFEHKFSDRARLWQNFEIFPQVDQFDNYIINFVVGIETAFTKSFSLKTYLEDTYANRPAQDRIKNDAKIVVAGSFKF